MNFFDILVKKNWKNLCFSWKFAFFFFVKNVAFFVVFVKKIRKKLYSFWQKLEKLRFLVKKNWKNLCFSWKFAFFLWLFFQKIEKCCFFVVFIKKIEKKSYYRYDFRSRKLCFCSFRWKKLRFWSKKIENGFLVKKLKNLRPCSFLGLGFGLGLGLGRKIDKLHLLFKKLAFFRLFHSKNWEKLHFLLLIILLRFWRKNEKMCIFSCDQKNWCSQKKFKVCFYDFGMCVFYLCVVQNGEKFGFLQKKLEKLRFARFSRN